MMRISAVIVFLVLAADMARARPFFWPFISEQASLLDNAGQPAFKGDNPMVDEHESSLVGGIFNYFLLPVIRWTRSPLFGYSTYRHIDFGGPGEVKSDFAVRIGPKPDYSYYTGKDQQQQHQIPRKVTTTTFGRGDLASSRQ